MVALAPRDPSQTHHTAGRRSVGRTCQAVLQEDARTTSLSAGRSSTSARPARARSGETRHERQEDHAGDAGTGKAASEIRIRDERAREREGNVACLRGRLSNEQRE